MEHNPLQSIDPKIIGERLRNARRARGMTQGQAADALGYARTTVVAIEKGERRVTEEELIRFAEQYGRSVSEFVTMRTNTQPLVPQFRSALPASRPGVPLAEEEFLKVAEELESLTADYLELEQLCEMPLPKEYPAVYRLEDSYNHPEELGEEIALEVRNRLGLGDAPIPDLRALLEEAVGLRVFFYPMPSLIAGLFACNDVVGGCVGINSQHPAARENFSLAHEYAHFLTTRYQADVALESGRWMRSPAEQFADSFAGNFLMPRSGVIRRFSELKDAREGEKNIRIADVLHLAQFYGVSVQAMCLRLEELRRLPSGTWDTLKSRGLKPERARAALGLVAATDNRQLLPQRYLMLAKRAYDAGLLSEGQLAKKLRTDRVSARLMMERLETLIDYKTGSGYLPLELDLATRLVEA
jgi:Zn-dependent peptidase ImmA (M78 family)/transcriptional regulator with XRE-family HTH domain